ncbi:MULTISPECIES: Mu transposase C-terminal domain-containing protein [unclassified Pantoea]|uniref:Mu transposase C-terminal domain-containing protein n=1 Tax=unclassified Pantoea TaxID=2630326 RepID=UPI001232C78A|nr:MULTISPECIES: Mu transposase C-terminal domain-containing protein [unclassified Pantoea]KAA5957783.1 DDE-type integrase/transposase/recombinase [Pantoea sp. VH_16]KAA6104659.1 DDE-type integrase/transposase/recombinase [Pantoea sp. Bo_14]KAA6108035.1 DDE-type integrase/transposase/recombinase [Pantoea sp. Bo_11]
MFVTVNELMGLPGLPGTLQGLRFTLNKRAAGLPELVRRREGTKAFEYHIDCLPDAAREVVKQRLMKQVIESSEGAGVVAPVSVAVKAKQELVLMQECPALAKRETDRLTEKQRRIADARCVLVMEVDRLRSLEGIKATRTGAVEYVAEQSRMGFRSERLQQAAELANARKGKRAGISVRSLQDWYSLYHSTTNSLERLVLLAPGQPKKLQPDDCAWWIAFKSYYGTPTGDSIKATWRKFKKWWEDQYHDQPAVLAVMPSYDIVRRMLKKEPLYKRMQGRVSGSAARAYDVYSKRDWSVMPVNGIWIADGKSLDMKVLHPVYNRPFTPELTLVIDGRTRVIVGWSLSLSENRFAVAEAYRHGMEKYGKPLFVYSDNGGGEKNNMLDADITGIFPRMGINHMTGIPGNPQARGIIERLNGVVPIAIARQFATYNGHNVDPEHQRVMGKKMVSLTNALRQGKELTTEQKRTLGLIPDWQALTVAIQAEIDAYNTSHEHSELPKVNGKHLSPLAYRRHALETEGDDIEYLTADELHDMFLPEETRTAARGWIQLGTNNYYARELIEVDQEKVRVAFNPLDAKEVYIRRLDGTFVCTAIWNGNTNAPVPLTRVEKALNERAQRQIKRGQAVIQDAKDSLRPAIEHREPLDISMFAAPEPIEQEEEIYIFASQEKFAAKKAGNY